MIPEGTAQYWQYVRLPAELQPDGAQKGTTSICRRLRKEVPGTKRAPRAWFTKWAREMNSQGLQQGKVDPSTWFCRDAQGRVRGYIPLHVDDCRGRGDDEFLQALPGILTDLFKMGKVAVNVDDTDYVGKAWCREERGESWGMTIGMQAYLDQKVEEMPLDPKVAKQTKDTPLTPTDHKRYQQAYGKALWPGQVMPEFSYELSIAARSGHAPTVGAALRLNKLIRTMRRRPKERKWFLPQLAKEKPLRVVVLVDYGGGDENSDPEARGQGAFAVLLMEDGDPDAGGKAALVQIKSRRLRRVVHASFDGESIVAIDGLDAGFGVAMLLQEWDCGPRPSLFERVAMHTEGAPYQELFPVLDLYTDSNCLVTRVKSQKVDSQLNKRRRQDMADIQESLQIGQVRSVRHVAGKTNPMNYLTKVCTENDPSFQPLLRLVYEGWYDPDFSQADARNRSVCVCRCCEGHRGPPDRRRLSS